jgi:integrase
MRDEFMRRFDSEKTRAKYDVIFRKFDEFLIKRETNEQDFITTIQNSQRHERYNFLQELVYFLSGSLSPRSTRNYFDSIFKYLLYAGCELDYTQKRVRVSFPRVTVKRPEGLDRSMIFTLLSNSDSLMSLYMRLLAASGMREEAALLLTPSHIEFDDFLMNNPARITVTADIAKFGIQHETFIPYDLGESVKAYIKANGIGNTDYIFIKEYKTGIVSAFDHKFGIIRKKSGFETHDKKPNEKHDIRLHSFRAWFITTWIDLGKEAFGRALTGNSKFLTTYFRKSREARLEEYKMHQLRFVF